MKLIISITTLIVVSVTASAQTFSLENWSKITSGSIVNTNLVFGTTQIGDHLHAEVFALVSTNGFAESYAGLGTSLGDHLYVSALIGLVASEDNPLRFATTIIASANKWKWLTIGEWGPGSGHWYNSYLSYAPDDGVSVGILARRFAGVGPRVDYVLGKISLWTGVLYDYEASGWTGNLGVKTTFK